MRFPSRRCSANRARPTRRATRRATRRTTPRTLRYRDTRPRDGRFFLDALIAIALLSVAGLAVTASTRALATLADDALLVAHAQAAATSVAEHAIAQLCDSLGTQPPHYGARLTVTSSTPRSNPPTRVVSARATPSPLSIRDSVQLSLSTARQCP